MSIPDMKCEACGRNRYTDKKGKIRELEICREVVTGKMLCFWCYLKISKDAL